METYPLISIALCTFQGECYLEEQLASLEAQTYPNLEIIVQDDASQDGTWALITAFKARDPRVRAYKNEKNLGFQANFESALRRCRGTWIAFCDQDDRWHPEKIARCYAHSAGKVLVYHDSAFIDADGQPLHTHISDRLRFVSGAQPASFLLFNCVSGHSMLLHRRLLPAVLPFPKRGFYDHWIAYVASMHGEIGFLAEALVEYRQHATTCTDLLGKKKRLSGLAHTRARMEREQHWLQICADYERSLGRFGLAQALFSASSRRLENALNIRFAWLLWKERRQLLHIVQKTEGAALLFAWRHLWGFGLKAKIKRGPWAASTRLS
ncbi:family 2 glycosyl transferase [Nitritalea halalkaliphila LW7]|uniref:Family 2 glycosyl transferase n=1 Tax=Nitritalea halalkaliphila LW7 TaxID=1189621 RepID=I5BTM1_9BACT|nr:glycosyltransferase family 2 protein [Nitritalea halalkaliphila]EIM72923.1 family 2 glycosyl transferase [Nitritalea halalkaliphila LW7]